MYWYGLKWQRRIGIISLSIGTGIGIGIWAENERMELEDLLLLFSQLFCQQASSYFL